VGKVRLLKKDQNEAALFPEQVPRKKNEGKKKKREANKRKRKGDEGKQSKTISLSGFLEKADRKRSLVRELETFEAGGPDSSRTKKEINGEKGKDRGEPEGKKPTAGRPLGKMGPSQKGQESIRGGGKPKGGKRKRGGVRETSISKFQRPC